MPQTKDFLDYFDLEGNDTLDDLLLKFFDKLQISWDQKIKIVSLISQIREKDLATYEHSLRVAMLAVRVGYVLKQEKELDLKALFYAGLFHDIGKIKINSKILKKKNNWTANDAKNMEKHVLLGFNLLKENNLDLTASIIVWHHEYQKNPYPFDSVEPLHNYDLKTKMIIPFYGRIIALVDCYDALHRINEKYLEDDFFSRDLIEIKILDLNPDQRPLIKNLYALKVF